MSIICIYMTYIYIYICYLKNNDIVYIKVIYMVLLNNMYG